MKTLLQHVDYIRFEVKRETKLAQKIPEELKKGEMKECLLMRFAAEKEDEGKEEIVAEKVVADLKNVLAQIKTNRVMVYPFVHLLYGSEPAGVSSSVKLLNLMKEKLERGGYEVKTAPFGYYKELELKCKGHPLSELSRIIRAAEGEKAKKAEEVVSASLKEEKEIKSEWLILSPDGKIVEADKFDFKNYGNLEKFYNYEHVKDRTVKEEPPHIKLMRSLEMVDYEPGSDPGNMRYYPKGRLAKSLLEQFVTEKVIKYGGMEVETPLMYDYEHPALKSYLNRFPARQYTVESAKKKFFLRFSACFGQFLMIKDAVLSYKDFPIKIYELTRYSFRLEKAGELAGLRRLRAFTMPDCHAMCRNVEEAKEEMKVRFGLVRDVLEGCGFLIPQDLEMAIRFTQEFWDKNKDFVIKMVKEWGKPVLVERWNTRYAYFILKYELNFVDALGKASALATDQIDVENAERYGITYVDADNSKKFPVILHLSPSGAIERVLYALLENAYIKSKRGEVPTLPLWLSPIQIRIAAVADRHLKDCEKIALLLEKENIRVDIDDRVETVGRKISDSEKEWVPYVIVIGDKEAESKELPVRVRENGKIVEMSIEELAKEIKKKTEGMPFKELALPKYLSKRPKFVG